MIIHQIWLTEYIPPHIVEWMKEWQKLPNYRLWRYKDVEPYWSYIQLAGLQKAKPALQSDLLRLLILKDLGWLYVDCDCKLVNPLPKELPEEFAGHWYDGADPFILRAKPETLQYMIDFGFKQTHAIHEIYQWGYKAFNNKWPGLVLDTSDWCKHISQHSWWYKNGWN